jgi:uncharacterized damage-inducible protein DinB
MTETTTLRTLLLPELEAEFKKTRKMLEAIPDGHTGFKPHEKSMSFARLAGHTAELPAFISYILATPGGDASTAGFKPHTLETRQQLLAEFDELADQALTDLKNSSDEALHQHWDMNFRGHEVYSGSRDNAYRTWGVNHLVHHRAQLGVFLRLLNQPIPGTYGPSADEK